MKNKKIKMNLQLFASQIPTILKGNKFEWAPYSATPPTTGWQELRNVFKSIPNFFPTGDAVDTTTLDNEMKTSIEGMPGSSDGFDFSVQYTPELEESFLEWIVDQEDLDKGFFWFRVTLVNRGKTYTFKSKTSRYLPLPDGVEAGGVDAFSLKLYPQSDIIIEEVI